jgi:hypothetical protein
MKLITAAECVRQLRQARAYKGKDSYFSRLVSMGVVPFHAKEGSPKKWYVLDEVKQALKDNEDPTRDAQREANEQKRRESAPKEMTAQKIEAELDRLRQVPRLTTELFNLDGLSEETPEEFAAGLDELNAQNWIILDMAFTFAGDLDERFGKQLVKGGVFELEMLRLFNRWVMWPADLAEMYEGVEFSGAVPVHLR